MAEAHGTPSVLVRLNYASDLRYGVLVDIARKVHRGEPVDLTTGYVNTIWQGDANAVMLRASTSAQRRQTCSTSPGRETLSVRQAALGVASLLGRPAPRFTGEEADTALSTTRAVVTELYRAARGLGEHADRMDGSLGRSRRPTLGKPTHFEIGDAPVLMADGVRSRLAGGLVIPAHPLALTAERRLDERHQRALTRYYLAAGAGGLAVGVHTTQFAIREPGCRSLPPGARARRRRRRVTRSGRRPCSSPGSLGRPDRRLPRRRPRPSRVRRRSARPGELSRARATTSSSPTAARRRGDPRVRLLPPAGGRRTPSRLRLLAAVRRDRAARGDQGRAVRPLPHARGRTRRRGGRQGGVRRPLHR